MNFRCAPNYRCNSSEIEEDETSNDRVSLIVFDENIAKDMDIAYGATIAAGMAMHFLYLLEFLRYITSDFNKAVVFARTLWCLCMFLFLQLT